jgi:adenylate kinase family enzyme
VKRILVIGCSGSGKTTLARWLATRLRLPLVTLDRDYWGPNLARPPEDAWRKTVRTLADREAWVMDGTYYATLAERLPTADTVVWLDFGRWRCLWRVLWRTERVDMEFLRYVWHFNELRRPRIGTVLAQARNSTVVVLRSPAEVSRFRKEFRLPA